MTLMYAKSFKRLKEELTEGVGHQNKMAYTADARALDLGGAPFFEIARKKIEVVAFQCADACRKVTRNAVQSKMKADGVDEPDLNLGGDALVSQLTRPVDKKI
ncbi:hypothetical protein PsorP6_010066 [Peronosclerospora sorghi]|uniref:Uncharacterized protein n=1 Tax=Peronosclerospora sorghi TaxID=230839 RepID=A0ACC0VVD8_9STRA|nr:hypothetical protein PsorP6_010066 [Peronosclerospora sorghi]